MLNVREQTLSNELVQPWSDVGPYVGATQPVIDAGVHEPGKSPAALSDEGFQDRDAPLGRNAPIVRSKEPQYWHVDTLEVR